MEGYLIALAGQTIAMMLVVGILRWVFSKVGSTEPTSTVLGFVAGMAFVTVAAGYGLADGGPPQFERAFASYLVGGIIALLIGLLTPGKKKA